MATKTWYILRCPPRSKLHLQDQQDQQSKKVIRSWKTLTRIQRSLVMCAKSTSPCVMMARRSTCGSILSSDPGSNRLVQRHWRNKAIALLFLSLENLRKIMVIKPYLAAQASSKSQQRMLRSMWSPTRTRILTWSLQMNSKKPKIKIVSWTSFCWRINPLTICVLFLTK